MMFGCARYVCRSGIVGAGPENCASKFGVRQWRDSNYWVAQGCDRKKPKAPIGAYSDIPDRFCGQMLRAATYLRRPWIAKEANGRIGRSDAEIVAIFDWRAV